VLTTFAGRGIRHAPAQGVITQEKLLKRVLKTLATLILVPVLLFSGLVAYYWFTYIDEDITVGSAYGFSIGSSKVEAVKDFDKLLTKNPGLHVYVSYGQRAGDNFSIPASPESIRRLESHDRWDLLLDGKSEFFNSTDLYFEKNQLVRIYRHRQYFELP
jgi:hypothetical protein